MGVLFSLATMSVCVPVGLPLRLTAFGRWWRPWPLVAPAGAGTGNALLGLSLLLHRAPTASAFTASSVIVLATTG